MQLSVSVIWVVSFGVHRGASASFRLCPNIRRGHLLQQKALNENGIRIVAELKVQRQLGDLFHRGNFGEGPGSPPIRRFVVGRAVAICIREYRATLGILYS